MRVDFTGLDGSYNVTGSSEYDAHIDAAVTSDVEGRVGITLAHQEDRWVEVVLTPREALALAAVLRQAALETLAEVSAQESL